MPKEEIPHTDAAKNENGEIVLHAFCGAARHALGQIEAGHYTVPAVGQYTVKDDEEHPAVEDILIGYDAVEGDEIYIFVRRNHEGGPGNRGTNPPRS